MLRVDVPDVPQAERERYGSRYEQPAEDGYTQYIGTGSINRLTPPTDATAREAASNQRRLPARQLDVPAAGALPAPQDTTSDDTYEDDDEDQL